MGEDPDILVLLTATRTEFEAETIAQSLNAHGVPAHAFGTAAAVGQWELGIRNEFQVMVRRRDLDLAKSVLGAIKADSVDIDWDEVDVGQPTDDPAPALPRARTARSAWARRVIFAVFIVAMVLIYWQLAVVAFGGALLWEFWAASKGRA